MATLYVTHRACIDHDTGPTHPERADRLRVIERMFEDEAFAFLHRAEAPRGDLALIKAVHDPGYVDMVLARIPQSGQVYLDGDTVVSPGSGEAALRAVGGACLAVDAVISGHERNAFLAARPPGHHAEYDKAMGFCLFNTAAIAAHHARRAHGLRRIAVVDFDVHHGNGTQNLFENDADLFYASTHQWPLYPGTGAAHERGCADNILNIPLEAGAGSEDIRLAFDAQILPALRRFGPELLIVSAGFDAHHRDPLAGLAFTDDDYAWMTRELLGVAAACCDNRLVSVLEGGYDLTGLGGGVMAHVRALMTA